MTDVMTEPRAATATVEAERCEACGCTNHGCPGGCLWVDDGLCSAFCTTGAVR